LNNFIDTSRRAAAIVVVEMKFNTEKEATRCKESIEISRPKLGGGKSQLNGVSIMDYISDAGSVMLETEDEKGLL
jgi:hypothetical protein